MSADDLDDLRRRLAERTAHSPADDIMTTTRLATMRRRLNELEQTSENSTDGAEVMAVEEEACAIMDSLGTCGTCDPPKTADALSSGPGSVLGATARLVPVTLDGHVNTASPCYEPSLTNFVL